MATITRTVDDVLYKQQGKEVEATETMQIRVPAIGSPEGKPVRFVIEVSEQGRKVADKMIADAEEAVRRAYAPLLALEPESKPRRRRSTPKAKRDDEQSPSEDPSGEEHSEQHSGY